MCRAWHFEFLEQAPFCILTTVPTYEYSLPDSKQETGLPMFSVLTDSYIDNDNERSSLLSLQTVNKNALRMRLFQCLMANLLLGKLPASKQAIISAMLYNVQYNILHLKRLLQHMKCTGETEYIPNTHLCYLYVEKAEFSSLFPLESKWWGGGKN